MVLAKATVAATPRSKVAVQVAWLYAVVLVIMIVGQLFAFERFIPIIYDYWLPGGYGTAVLVACVTVVAEVFALPYLLRMPLSPLMRQCSMVCSVIVPLIWGGLVVYHFGYGGHLANAGMFGAKVTVSPVLQLAAAGVLLVLSVVVIRGLRPVAQN